MEPADLLKKSADRANNILRLMKSFSDRHCEEIKNGLATNESHVDADIRKFFVQLLVIRKMYADAVDRVYHQCTWLQRSYSRKQKLGKIRADLNAHLFLNDTIEDYYERRIESGEMLIDTANSIEEFGIDLTPNEIQAALSILKTEWDQMKAEDAAGIQGALLYFFLKDGENYAV